MKTTAELYEKTQYVMNMADEYTADVLDELWFTLQQREDSTDILQKIIDYWEYRANQAESQIKAVLESLPHGEDLTEAENLLIEKVTHSIAVNAEPLDVDDVDTLLALAADKEHGIEQRIQTILKKLEPQKIIDKLLRMGWTIPLKDQLPHIAVVSSPRGERINIPLDSSFADYDRRMNEAISAIAKERIGESIKS